MTRLKYLDPADGQYKLLPVGGGAGGGPDEVTISPDAPGSPYTDLWVDTDAPAPVTDWSVADNRYLTSGFRNVIRNGDMSVAQRGNGPVVGSGWTLDGWGLDSTGGTTTCQRDTTNVGPTAGYYHKTTISGQSGANDYSLLHVPIENVSTLNGRIVTLSFDIYATSGTPSVGVELAQNFGTGGSPSTRVLLALGAVKMSTTRARYSLTFTVPSTAGKVVGTNGYDYLQLLFWLSAGSNMAARSSNIGIQNNSFWITDIQLEAGSTASPFERLPVQQQLAWCQRYFVRIVPNEMDGQAAIGQVQAPTIAGIHLSYPVQMRAVPVFSSSGASTWGLYPASYSSNISGTSIGVWAVNQYAARMYLGVASGLVAGNACMFAAKSTSSYIDFSAEF